MGERARKVLKKRIAHKRENMTENIDSFHFGKRESGIWNDAAEAAIIGAIIANNIAFDKIQGTLRAEHFAVQTYQEIYQILGDRIGRGKNTDAVILLEILRARHKLEGQKLEEMKELIVTALDSAAFGPEIKDYAQLVADLFTRRKIAEIAAAAIDMAKAPPSEETGSNIIELMQSQLMDAMPVEQGGGWFTLREGVEAMAVDYMDGRGGCHLKYGITEIDKRTGGLFPGDLVIVAGRPSMGKTTFVNYVAQSAYKAKHQTEEDPETGRPRDPVIGIIDIEMNRDQMAQRYVSAAFYDDLDEDLPYQNFRTRNVPFHDEGFRRKFLEVVENTPNIYRQILNEPTFERIKAECRTLLRRAGKLDLVIIDYLQLIDIPVPRNSTFTEEIGKVTRRLKAMAKEFGCTVMVLSQLSRGVDSRDNKRPLMTDLRSSGGIEQDADTIHLLYRAEYYLEREGEPDDPKRANEYQVKVAAAKDKVEVLTPKLRMGRPGDDELMWNAPHGVYYSKFSQRNTDQGGLL